MTSENRKPSGQQDSSPDMNGRKRALRRIVADRRKEYKRQWFEEMSRRITGRILALDLWREARTVFFYMDLPGEVMTRAMILRCLEDGKRAAVPRITAITAAGDPSSKAKITLPEARRGMCFYELRDFDHLVRGAMNIPEPDPAFSSCLDEEEDALIIMPGTAFDRSRNRIGYGGGFYDRYLDRHRHHPTVAVAYDFQIFDEVPHSDTDIRPSLLVTPAGII